MFELLKNLITNNVFLGIVAIVSLLLAVLSTIDSKKSKNDLKRYKYLFNLADKNIDKEVTSKTLEKLHKEKENEQKEIDTLKSIIKKDLPLEAQRTVLLDKLKESEKHLVHSYDSYVNTKKEYEQLSQKEINIPKYVLDEIELHIMPEYLIQKKRQRYMSMLTYISYISAFLSIIPVVQIIGNFTIIVSIYPLIQIFMLHMPKNKKKRKDYLKRIAYFLVLTVLGVYNFVILIATFDHWYINDYFILTAFITYPIFIVLLLIKYITIFKKIENKWH